PCVPLRLGRQAEVDRRWQVREPVARCRGIPGGAARNRARHPRGIAQSGCQDRRAGSQAQCPRSQGNRGPYPHHRRRSRAAIEECGREPGFGRGGSPDPRDRQGGSGLGHCRCAETCASRPDRPGHSRAIPEHRGQESVDAAGEREIRFPDGAASDAGMPGNRRDSGQYAGTHRSDQRSPRHPQVPLPLQVQWLRSSRRSRLFDGGHGRHVGHQRWWFAGQDLERSAARNPQGCRACGLSRRLHPRGLPVQLRRRALQEIAMPKKSWTPEERKAFGDKMKARRDAVKQASEVKKTYTEFGTAGPEVKEKVIHEVGVAMPRDEPTPEMQTPDPTRPETIPPNLFSGFTKRLEYFGDREGYRRRWFNDSQGGTNIGMALKSGWTFVERTEVSLNAAVTPRNTDLGSRVSQYVGTNHETGGALHAYLLEKPLWLCKIHDEGPGSREAYHKALEAQINAGQIGRQPGDGREQVDKYWPGFQATSVRTFFGADQKKTRGE